MKRINLTACIVCLAVAGGGIMVEPAQASVTKKVIAGAAAYGVYHHYHKKHERQKAARAAAAQHQHGH
jgi:hypothetical protein